MRVLRLLSWTLTRGPCWTLWPLKLWPSDANDRGVMRWNSEMDLPGIAWSIQVTDFFTTW